jgi:hypothetical protein
MKDRMEQEEVAARALAERALAHLPRPSLSPAFEAALLASYDGWRAGRRRGMAAGLAGAVRAFAATVWPGAPAWAPAGAFAAALLIGIGLGAVVPGSGQRQAFSLEQAPSFSLVSEEDF